MRPATPRSTRPADAGGIARAVGGQVGYLRDLHAASSAALILFPIYWMFTISLKMPREIYRLPSLWPEIVTLDNYRELIDEKGFLTNIRNSLIVAGSVTVVSLIISSLRRLQHGPLQVPLQGRRSAG